MGDGSRARGQQRLVSRLSLAFNDLPPETTQGGFKWAFHVVGSTTTLIVFTGGLLQLPTDVCLFTWIGGNPPPAVYEQFETNVFVAGS